MTCLEDGEHNYMSKQPASGHPRTHDQQ